MQSALYVSGVPQIILHCHPRILPRHLLYLGGGHVKKGGDPGMACRQGPAPYFTAFLNPVTFFLSFNSFFCYSTLINILS